jgi:hypothetical protein
MYEVRKRHRVAHREAAELAIVFAGNARGSARRPVAAELWRMAKEYQAEAVILDRNQPVEIGNPPSSLSG